MPRYGYLLEANDKSVGVILLISSLRRIGDRQELFSNLSGWYVEPDFRSGATQLLKRALANKQTTYLNLYPAIHVRPIIEAFGFRRYSEGQVLSPLALACNQRNIRVSIVGVDGLNDSDLEEKERRLLQAQADYGMHRLLLQDRRPTEALRVCTPRYQKIHSMCAARLLPQNRRPHRSRWHCWPLSAVAWSTVRAHRRKWTNRRDTRQVFR